MRDLNRFLECGGRDLALRSLSLARTGHGTRQGRGGFSSRRGGGFGGGDDDFSRGRKFNSDDLQLLILALILEAPRHGYELIKLLETRSNGFYAPSPGMVYPALTYLEEIGYALVVAEGNRKSYSLTALGRACVESNRERIDLIWAKLAFLGRKMALVRSALADEGGDAERSGERVCKELLEARLKLKQQLFVRGHASSDEQLRIAKVLERAAAEIAAIADQDPKEK